MGRRRKAPVEKLKELPAKYVAGLFGCDLIDWGSAVGQEYASAVLLLADQYGGWDSLTYAKRLLVEEAAYDAIKTRQFRLADLQGKPLPHDHGAHHNKVNTLKGHLKDLGLEQVIKNIRPLREVMRGSAA